MTNTQEKTRRSPALIPDMHAVAGDDAVFIAAPLNVWAKLFAAHAGNALDGWALAGSDRLAVLPLADARLGYADQEPEIGLTEAMVLSIAKDDVHVHDYQPCCLPCQQPGSCFSSVTLINMRA